MKKEKKLYELYESFLPIYLRLDEEVSALTDTIFFYDDQLDVYSLAIGDLIIRCVIEIELVDGEYILVQAKAIENASNDFRNVRSNMKKGVL